LRCKFQAKTNCMITPDMKEFWNERYGSEEYVYGTNPNQFLKEQLSNLNPGKILLPGDGEGRNAAFAASSGWDVWAFDQSTEGKQKAMRLAREQKVEDRIRYEVCDVTDYETEGNFDLVASIYFHLPKKLRISFHRKVYEWLKPGGLYLIEAFRPEQVLNQRNTGGPKTVELMETVEELRGTLADLEIEQLESLTVHLKEGRHHEGDADIIRFLGRKKQQ
jgi:SAM-dependent methyltransferase